jgi:predicted metal-binding membrane protein
MTAFSLRSLGLSLRRQPGKAGLALGLAAAILLAGAGLYMKAMTTDSSGSGMPIPVAWTFATAAQNFVMWGMMMVAMMLPGAAPSILQWAGPAAERRQGPDGIPPALAFGGGYLLVWAGFSLAATGLQWALDANGLLSESLALRSSLLAGGLLIVIGVYQLTPLKQAVLRRCRSTAACLPGEPDQGLGAAARQGLRHSLACLAGCWGPMCLLFVVGLMNLLWIALIALWVLAENNQSWGGRLGRLGGAGLIVWGAAVLVLAH